MKDSRLLTALAMAGSLAYAGPSTIIYQGSLLNNRGVPVADGTYRMHFAAYDVDTGGSPLWEETDDTVAVYNALFATTLGDDTGFGSLFVTNSDLWLAVSIDLDASGTYEPEERFEPRHKLAGAAWALDADTLDGLHASDFWRRSGNPGTNPAMHFVGTTDNKALEFRVNNTRALRLEPQQDSPSIIAGYRGNSLFKNVAGASIGGGGAPDDGSGNPAPNQITDSYGVVGGGADNQVGDADKSTTSAMYATIGGGFRNRALGIGSAVTGGVRNEATTTAGTVAGGAMNAAEGPGASVGGGSQNTAGATAATVGGGLANTALGEGATVPGGGLNAATGDYSLAAGFYAQATHEGAFVWADHQAAPFASTADNEFRVRASGGVDFQSQDCKITLSPDASAPNFVAGHADNQFDAGVYGATISGGGTEVGPNQVLDNFGSVGGGYNNRAGGGSGLMATPGSYATVGGGRNNEANGQYATIAGGTDNLAGHDGLVPTVDASTVGGGRLNKARGTYATVAGGHENIADNDASAIGGGMDNQAGAAFSTIPGGLSNQTSGAYSFAAGRRAIASHQGSFVWADSLDHSFYSAAANGFRARATGGAQFITAVDPSGNPTAGVSVPSGSGAWQNYSDRDAKENAKPVDPRKVLARVAELPIATWNYRTQPPSIRHMGPTAQDFRTAFGLGGSDKMISTIDPDGVALAAIQGLLQLAEEKQTEIEALKALDNTRRQEIGQLEARLAFLEARVLGQPED